MFILNIAYADESRSIKQIKEAKVSKEALKLQKPLPHSANKIGGGGPVTTPTPAGPIKTGGTTHFP